MKSTTHYETFKRWPLIPINKTFNIFLHVYLSDRELVYHDHPWWNVTIKLWGQMHEVIIKNYMSLDRGKKIDVSRRRIVFRRATTAHKTKMLSKRLITLFITGPTWNVVGGLH